MVSSPGGDAVPAGSSLHSLPPAQVDESVRCAELLSRCARGQEEAFAELYDITAARVHGVVLRVVRSADHAAEVTQEAFLEIWRQSARYDQRLGKPLSWMITIAHRRAIDRVRSVSSDVARDDGYATELQVGQPRTSEPSRDDVWSQVETRLESERVRKALDRLTPIQREALVLAYFGGYTHPEIAELLDLPLGTVKTRIRDGMIGLRDALGVEKTAETTKEVAR